MASLIPFLRSLFYTSTAFTGLYLLVSVLPNFTLFDHFSIQNLLVGMVLNNDCVHTNY